MNRPPNNGMQRTALRAAADAKRWIAGLGDLKMPRVHAVIEGMEFTLFYDYDQLRDGKLSRLTDSGKVQWFSDRMDMVFVDPLGRIFDTASVAHRELNSSPDDIKPRTIMIGAFALLLNGIESCGSFITDFPPSTNKKNWRRFNAFMTKYMSVWNAMVVGTSHKNKNMIAILWEHFRNGIAHGFSVTSGGIEYLGGPRWRVSSGIMEIDPVLFFKDFLRAKDDLLRDINDKMAREHAHFLKRFRDVYPC